MNWHGIAERMPRESAFVWMSIRIALLVYDVKRGYWDGQAWRYENGRAVQQPVTHWREG